LPEGIFVVPGKILGKEMIFLKMISTFTEILTSESHLFKIKYGITIF